MALSDLIETEILYSDAVKGPFPTSFTAVASDAVYVKNFNWVDFVVYVDNKASVTQVQIRVYFSTDASPTTDPADAAGDWTIVQTEALDRDNISIQSGYEYSKLTDAMTVPFTLPISVPVRGLWMRVQIEAVGSAVGSLIYVTSKRRVT